MLNRLRDFFGAKDGAVAVIFAVSMFPITALVASAVDLSRMSQNQTHLQAAIDSAALRVARDVADGKTFTNLSDEARRAVESNIQSGELTNLSVSATMDNLAVNITGRAEIAPIMPGILNVQALAVTGKSSAVWRTKKIELALVLDNTGSMAGAKITALKDAAKNLVTTLRAVSSSNDAVRIGIVPFDTVVNIGTGYRDSGIIDFSSVSQSSWTGCVADRNQPYDTDDTSPVIGQTATLYPARNCSLAPIMPLTNNWSGLTSRIDQMRASGNTNVTIGVVWGFHMLTKSSPLTEARTVQEEPDLEKIMILLTDGDNTQNRWTTNSSSIDARTDLACRNAKAAGIRIYTIRVINGDEALLRGCATSSSMYYDVRAASELGPVFQAISAEIGQLRLSK
ncbi:MAG: TadE/TadG family type IV pilus assembly protein [Alphaproteobacteria bacterium]|jgi:Flp pilus assembly protein TadG